MKCEICNVNVVNFAEHEKSKAHLKLQKLMRPVCKPCQIGPLKLEILYDPTISIRKKNTLPRKYKIDEYRNKKVILKELKGKSTFVHVNVLKSKIAGHEYIRAKNNGLPLTIASDYKRTDTKISPFGKILRQTDKEGVEAVKCHNDCSYEVTHPELPKISLLDIEWYRTQKIPGTPEEILGRVLQFLSNLFAKTGIRYSLDDTYILTGSRRIKNDFKHSYHVINPTIMFENNQHEKIFKIFLIAEMRGTEFVNIIDTSPIGKANGQMRLYLKGKIEEPHSVLKLVHVPKGIIASNVSPIDLLYCRYPGIHNATGFPCEPVSGPSVREANVVSPQYFNVAHDDCIKYQVEALRRVKNVHISDTMSKRAIISRFCSEFRSEKQTALALLKGSTRELTSAEVENLSDITFCLSLIPNKGDNYQSKTTWLKIMGSYKVNGGDFPSFMEWDRGEPSKVRKLWNTVYGDGDFLHRCLEILYNHELIQEPYEEVVIKDYTTLREKGWEVVTDTKSEVVLHTPGSKIKGAWSVKQLRVITTAIIRGKPASGKTHAAAYILNSFLREDPEFSAVVITVRRAQSTNARYAFQKRTRQEWICYLDNNEETGTRVDVSSAKFLVISCESLHRLKDRTFSMVICDEISSATEQLNSPTFWGTNPIESSRVYANLVKNAIYLFMADGYLNQQALENIKMLRGEGGSTSPAQKPPKSHRIFNLEKSRFERKVVFHLNVSKKIAEEAHGLHQRITDKKRSTNRKVDSILFQIKKWKKRHRHFTFPPLESAIKEQNIDLCVSLLENLEPTQSKNALLKNYFESLQRGEKVVGVFAHKTELLSFLDNLRKKLSNFDDYEHVILHGGVDDKKKMITDVNSLWGKPNVHLMFTGTITCGVDMTLSEEEVAGGLRCFDKMFVLAGVGGSSARDIAQGWDRTRQVPHMEVAIVSGNTRFSPVLGYENVKRYEETRKTVMEEYRALQTEKIECLQANERSKHKNCFSKMPDWYWYNHIWSKTTENLNNRSDQYHKLIDHFAKTRFGAENITYKYTIGTKFVRTKMTLPRFDDIRSLTKSKADEIELKVKLAKATEIEKIEREKYLVSCSLESCLEHNARALRGLGERSWPKGLARRDRSPAVTLDSSPLAVRAPLPERTKRSGVGRLPALKKERLEDDRSPAVPLNHTRVFWDSLFRFPKERKQYFRVKDETTDLELERYNLLKKYTPQFVPELDIRFRILVEKIKKITGWLRLPSFTVSEFTEEQVKGWSEHVLSLEKEIFTLYGSIRPSRRQKYLGKSEADKTVVLLDKILLNHCAGSFSKVEKLNPTDEVIKAKLTQAGLFSVRGKGCGLNHKLMNKKKYGQELIIRGTAAKDVPTKLGDRKEMTKELRKDFGQTVTVYLKGKPNPECDKSFHDHVISTHRVGGTGFDFDEVIKELPDHRALEMIGRMFEAGNRPTPLRFVRSGNGARTASGERAAEAKTLIAEYLGIRKTPVVMTPVALALLYNSFKRPTQLKKYINKLNTEQLEVFKMLGDAKVELGEADYRIIFQNPSARVPDISQFSNESREFVAGAKKLKHWLRHAGFTDTEINTKTPLRWNEFKLAKEFFAWRVVLHCVCHKGVSLCPEIKRQFLSSFPQTKVIFDLWDQLTELEVQPAPQRYLRHLEKPGIEFRIYFLLSKNKNVKKTALRSYFDSLNLTPEQRQLVNANLERPEQTFRKKREEQRKLLRDRSRIEYYMKYLNRKKEGGESWFIF